MKAMLVIIILISGFVFLFIAGIFSLMIAGSRADRHEEELLRKMKGIKNEKVDN